MNSVRENMKNKSLRGVILVITALLLPVLIALMGLAVDFSFLYVQRNKLQDVADAAALAGAAQIDQEGRYAGWAVTDYTGGNHLKVGETVLEYIKMNDASFKNINIDTSNFQYKGVYRYSNGESGEKNNDDASRPFVKLMKLEYWTDPDKGPKIAADMKVKVEYAISGPLNKDEFLPKDEETPLPAVPKNERVRVRLTKRVSLPFWGAFLEKYEQGVPLTVKAAAKVINDFGNNGGGIGETTNYSISRKVIEISGPNDISSFVAHFGSAGSSGAPDAVHKQMILVE